MNKTPLLWTLTKVQTKRLQICPLLQDAERASLMLPTVLIERATTSAYGGVCEYQSGLCVTTPSWFQHRLPLSRVGQQIQ